jgi:hypothetical protein
MRGGGIVALADGGDVYDPDMFDTDLMTQAQREEEEYLDALNNMVAMASEIGLMGSPDKRMVPFRDKTPDVESVANMQQPAPQQAQQQASRQPSNGIDNLISGAAERYNLPPELLRNVASAESAGKAEAQNPRSSAKGVFQFIDSTWEGLGGTPGNQFDPTENVELGAKYLRQNAERLKKELGRDPSYSEVYAAHYFGPGVTRMLKNADMNDPINAGLAMFNSPNAVDRILKANPNLRGKTVGEVLASLESKAGEGIVPLAQGGVVRFDNGGQAKTPFGRWLSENYTPVDIYGSSAPGSAMDYMSASPLGFVLPQTDEEREAAQQAVAASEASLVPVPKAPEKKKEEKPKPQAKNEKPEEIQAVDVTDKKTMQETSAQPSEKVPEKARTLYDEFLEDYQSSKSDRERQKKMDAYMALATAGFAMAGGQSPNALQNISQGALAGMAQYGGSRKAAQQAEREDAKNLLTAQRYQELGEAARATQAMNETRLTDAERNRIGQAILAREEAVVSQIPGGRLNEKAYNAAITKLQQDPSYQALVSTYNQLLGVPAAQTTPQNYSGFKILNAK